MIDERPSPEERGMFGSLSDGAVCSLVLGLLLAALWVINGAERSGTAVNGNRFSGGMERPSLHLVCTAPSFGSTVSEELALQRSLYAGLPYVAVHLFSPSAGDPSVQDADAPAAGAASSISTQQDLSLYQFMELAPGIDPGAFDTGGRRAALLIPRIRNGR